MSDFLEFTGERFTPECQREIWYEHFHRYVLAKRWCAKARVLDAACGEGYGSALLAHSAASVESVDISDQTIKHARQRYRHLDNINFQVADCINLPFDDNEFDVVVSFETLEHLEAQDQLLAEFRRVLKPEGFLVLSSPDKAVYSDGQDSVNEFHVKELYRDELEKLIGRHFPAHRLLGQKLMFHSAIWALGELNQISLDQLSLKSVDTPASITQPPMYFMALCAAKVTELPDVAGRLWLFDDRDESVYRHYYEEIRHHMTVGKLISGLEGEIKALKEQIGTMTTVRSPWWRRFLGKS